MKSFECNVIGHIESPYKEKFAIPRQPGLVPGGSGRLHLHPPYNDPNSIRGLDQFSHILGTICFPPNHARGGGNH
ncbi:putative methyltransferase, YaeB/AF_0241 family [Providencia stuartii]|nr:putative methyltransferase, YaeB/AF_0241 family [Providencia stuartii]